MKRRMMWAVELPPDTDKRETLGRLTLSTTKPQGGGHIRRVAVYR